MGEIKFIVYINEQSTRPLVHSIAEAKRHATRNIGYAPELRIECYSRLCLISEWIFDYHAGSWVEQVVSSNAALYRKLQP
jgi:hypothetical protein